MLTDRRAEVLIIGFDDAVFAVGTAVETTVTLVVERGSRLFVGLGAPVSMVDDAAVDECPCEG